jgi:hypothetical protein
MTRVRVVVAAAVALLLLAPAASGLPDAIEFSPPSRVDRPGRGGEQARPNRPQVVELASEPLVIWEDDRDVRLRYLGALRRGDDWTEVDPRLPSEATTFASDGDGTVWSLADSARGIRATSTRGGRTWEPGPHLIGPHASWHALAAAGRDGRLLVARAALDAQNCSRVGRLDNMPTGGARGDGTGLHVSEVGRGNAGGVAWQIDPSGRYLDVDVAISPSGVGWVAGATLHGIRLFREREAGGGWAPVAIPPIVPAASIQRVRIAPTESEVVVMWQLVRGRDREIVSRAYRLASGTWGAPRVLGSHDGEPSLDATITPPSRSGDESSVVAVWIAANLVEVAERHRRHWSSSPPGGGGLPEAVSVATVNGRAMLVYAARRVDGSTTAEYGGPNTDVFVRTQEGEGHWEPGERVDRDATLMKRPGEPRVWTSEEDAFVAFNDDAFGAGEPVVSRRSGRGWTDPQRLVVDGEPGEIVLVAPDGSRVVRAGSTFVFQDASGTTMSKVEDVGRENDVVATGVRTFVVATIVGDPGRGEDQRFEISEIAGTAKRAARLRIGPATGVDLYADGDGGAHVVTTRYNRDAETLVVEKRSFRDGRLGAPRVIAADAPPGHVVTTDGDGGLLVGSRLPDGIVIVRSNGAAQSVRYSRPGHQFQLDAAGDRTVILASSLRGKHLLVARSVGGSFTVLPPLPGRFAKIGGLGYGYVASSSGVRGPAACFAFHPRTPDTWSGMTGWATQLHLTDEGRITVTARHRADVLIAQMDAGATEWTYGEAGTRSKSASGDVAIDLDGDAVVAWTDVTGGMHRVFATSAVKPSRGGLVAPASFFGALVLLALAFVLRRRAA